MLRLYAHIAGPPWARGMLDQGNRVRGRRITDSLRRPLSHHNFYNKSRLVVSRCILLAVREPRMISSSGVARQWSIHSRGRGLGKAAGHSQCQSAHPHTPLSTRRHDRNWRRWLKYNTIKLALAFAGHQCTGPAHILAIRDAAVISSSDQQLPAPH